MRDKLAAEKPEERERRLHQMSTKQGERLEAETPTAKKHQPA